MTEGELIAGRARRCVGARFRAQGRDPESGFDCIGVAATALALSRVRSDYSLRGGSVAELTDALTAIGLSPVGRASPGDVLVMIAGPEQLHLGVATDVGFVHAHAGLGRVVETPGTPEWPVVGIWRRVAAGD